MQSLRWTILLLSMAILLLLGFAYYDSFHRTQRLLGSLPSPPTIEVPAFDRPSLPKTDVEVIDRAIDFGPRSAIVGAELHRIFYEALQTKGGQDAAISALIDATRSVEDVTEKIRLAEIQQLQHAVTEIRDDVSRYRTSVEVRISGQPRLSVAEFVALVFAGTLSFTAIVTLFARQN